MKTKFLILLIVIISASITAIIAPTALYSSDNTDGEEEFLEENDASNSNSMFDGLLKDNSINSSDDASLNSNGFGFKFYRHLSDSDENLFFSPISIDIVFAIIYEAAQGETRENMHQLFAFEQDSEKRRLAYKNTIQNLNQKNPDFELNVKNGIWVSDMYELNPEYAKIVTNDYVASSQNVDFVSNHGVQTINQWVKENTNGKIEKIFEDNSTGQLTLMAATNTVYFNGLWEDPFPAGMTYERNFFVTPDSVEMIEMMKLKNYHFNYYEDDAVKIVELPYKGGKASMYLLQSFEMHQLKQLENNLTANYFNELKFKLSEKMVSVIIPKFSMELDYNLREILKEMGMTHPFSRELSNLSGMADYPVIFIDEAVHKTAIDLHELGTEAAAATGAMAELLSGSPYTFYGNHPFVYIIQDHETDQILFMGRFVSPDH